MSERRVIRGGSCNFGTWNLRTSRRVGIVPENRNGNLGLRIVVVIKQKRG